MSDYFEYEAATRRQLEEQAPREREKMQIRRVGIGIGLALFGMNVISLLLPRIVSKMLQSGGWMSSLEKEAFWHLQPELYYAVNMAIYLCMVLLPFLMLIPCLRLRGFAAFPFRKIQHGREGARLIFIGFGACLLSQMLASLTNTVLEDAFGIINTADGSACGDTPLQKLLFFVTVAVLPPLAEEFSFRGVVLGALRPFGEGFAVLMSALVFGLMHGNLQQIPFAFGCGLILGYMTVRTESVWPSVLVHFLNNLLSVLREILPNALIEWVFFAIYGLGILLALFFVLRYLYKQMDAFSLRDYHTELLTDRQKVGAFFLNPGMIFGCAAILMMICLSTKLRWLP